MLCLSQDKSSEDDELDDDTIMDDRRAVVVGVCAMAKKSNSRPMQEILERLVLFKDIRTFVFEESVILHVTICYILLSIILWFWVFIIAVKLFAFVC